MLPTVATSAAFARRLQFCTILQARLGDRKINAVWEQYKLDTARENLGTVEPAALRRQFNSKVQQAQNCHELRRPSEKAMKKEMAHRQGKWLSSGHPDVLLWGHSVLGAHLGMAFLQFKKVLMCETKELGFGADPAALLLSGPSGCAIDQSAALYAYGKRLREMQITRCSSSAFACIRAACVDLGSLGVRQMDIVANALTYDCCGRILMEGVAYNELPAPSVPDEISAAFLESARCGGPIYLVCATVGDQPAKFAS
jgi:hypothetical protein